MTRRNVTIDDTPPSKRRMTATVRITSQRELSAPLVHYTVTLRFTGTVQFRSWELCNIVPPAPYELEAAIVKLAIASVESNVS